MHRKPPSNILRAVRRKRQKRKLNEDEKQKRREAREIQTELEPRGECVQRFSSLISNSFLRFSSSLRAFFLPFNSNSSVASPVSLTREEFRRKKLMQQQLDDALALSRLENWKSDNSGEDQLRP
jgi:hypothetical protein